MPVAYVVYFAVVSASIGIIITLVTVFASNYFGLDISKNLWVLAIPVFLTLALNVLLIELFGRKKRQ